MVFLISFGWFLQTCWRQYSEYKENQELLSELEPWRRSLQKLSREELQKEYKFFRNKVVDEDKVHKKVTLQYRILYEMTSNVKASHKRELLLGKMVARVVALVQR